ncbi:MAG TPA: FAD:protein FMN transferase, partial [Myxococcota bacterium]|nr:FAD:protein FMN transferase [Myxococcota bacterium]
TACRSVTLFAPTALQADGLDDVVFILGPERGLALVEATPGVGAVIVDATNKVWISRNLTETVQVLRPPSE